MTNRRLNAPISPADPDPLLGKVALVTGGARRIGRAVALCLARQGMDVAITYQHSARAAAQVVRAVQQLGRDGLAIRVDLARSDAAQRVYAAFTRRFARLDALVNNASAYESSALGRIQARDFDNVLAINARAPLLLIQQFAPLLAARCRAVDPTSLGRVVNFLDIHSLTQHRKGYVLYNASKAALHGITQTLALELAPQITVNAVAPGVVAWPPSSEYSPAQRARYLKRVPLGRAGIPQDAAAAVLFLVRDAHYCTGQIIAVDGGRGLT